MSGASGDTDTGKPHPDAVPVQNADGTQGWMISDAVAAALRPVGLGGFVPGQSVPPQSVMTSGDADDQSAMTTGEADDHAHQSVSTAGQGAGQSADGQRHAKASNFTNDSQHAAQGQTADGGTWTTNHRKSMSAEHFESTTTSSGGTTQHTSSSGNPNSTTGAVNQTADTQANAEGAAGRAYNKVDQHVGHGPGATGSAEGMSENVTKTADEPAHANAGSASVVKPKSEAHTYGGSAPNSEHASDGLTNAVHNNATSQALS